MIGLRPRGDPDVTGILVQVLAAFAVGAAVGAGLRGLDHLLAERLPLVVSAASYRALLGAVLSGLVTVTAFALWMRTVMTGMVAGQISPRVLAGLLDDRYQRSLLATMAASLGVVSVPLVWLPADGMAAAPASLPVALVVTVTALGGILVALNRAVRDASVSGLLTRQVERTRRLLQERAALQHQHGGVAMEDAPVPERVVDVHCERTGWVRWVDREAMVAALPRGAQAILHVRAGQLIADGDVIASASLELEPRHERALRRAVATGAHRRPDDDVGHLIEQVVDMATHALSPGSNDTATAAESMRAAGILLSALVETGEPVRIVADGDRQLLDVAAQGVRETVRTNVERLRMAAAVNPQSARQFLQAANTVVGTARRRGRDDVVADVVEQGQRFLTQVEDGDLAAADLDDLRTAVRSWD